MKLDITSGTKPPTGEKKEALDEMFESLKDKDQVKSVSSSIFPFTVVTVIII